MSQKIIGVTVGTPTPRANLKQTDPRKADYVKGKDIIPTKASQLENDAGYLNEDDISGITPHIGVNGNWYLGETDTGVKAEVPEFKLMHYKATNAAGVNREGIEIRIVTRDENGEEITHSTGVVWGTDFEATGGLDSPGGSSGGASGSGTALVTAPHIGENGNWFIGETDTGVNAQGEDGVGIADIQKRTVAGREVLYIILSDGVEKGFALPVPENGKDYVLTDTDKAEIAELAADLVDVPEGSAGGGYVAQDTAPEDTTLLWVDTSDDSDDDYQEAVNAALAQAKAGGEFDGQRGTGLLPVTTAPASYTTAVGGITPKYRMAISTIKTQAGVTEVLLGDTIRYSYYHYPIAHLDASYAYFTTRVSIRGATGAAGTTPVKGTDYFTDADKTEMVNQVKASLTTESWTFTLDDGSTVTKAVYIG